jgi:predicted deacylase
MGQKKIIALISVVVIIISLSVFIFINKNRTKIEEPVEIPKPEETTLPIETVYNTLEVIGYSVENRPIKSYTFGNGRTTLLFVGGIHGGYEWNSSLLAYEFIDLLESETYVIPDEIKIVVIPSLNPDGLYSVVKKEDRFSAEEIPKNDAHATGQGRFNANEVDLNRNFDCKWQPESTWRNKVVKAGTKAFSEPEALALKNLVEKIKPAAVTFWHSQANTVYASECQDGVLPQTLKLMNAYADAADYKKVATFDVYPVSGDAEGWLASIGIPAITVELETRLSSEWERNKKGIEAIINLYTN